MSNVTLFILCILFIDIEILPAQISNWSPEEPLTQGYFDSNPSFIVKEIYTGNRQRTEFLIFERRNNDTDSLSRICILIMDTNGVMGEVTELTDGNSKDRNPKVARGYNYTSGIQEALAVWERHIGKRSNILSSFFRIQSGWSAPIMIDSSDDCHDPKVASLSSEIFKIIYQRGDDIIYKEYDPLINQTLYTYNLTENDNAKCSKPEVRARTSTTGAYVMYRQQRSISEHNVIFRMLTENSVWTSPEILSDQGDNRPGEFLIHYKGYHPSYESNKFGRWNVYASGLGMDTIHNSNPQADIHTYRRFFNNAVTNNIIYSHADAYIEDYLNERRIILNSHNTDTVLLDQNYNTRITINGGLQFYNYHYQIWVAYDRYVKGRSSIFGRSSFVINVGVTNSNSYQPENFSLSQNYPNPFNPKTIINYQLSIINDVVLKVYDALGNEIATLVNEKQNAGSYEVEFDGSNFPSGIYFYKLETGSFSETKRMILLK